MKLNLLPGQEAMLAVADVICVPVSRAGFSELHATMLARLVPSDLLPPADELLSLKNGVLVFHGAASGRRVKLLVLSEGESMTEASAYGMGKKLAIRARQDEWLADSNRVTSEEVANFGIGRRLLQNLLAMFGPLL